MKTPKHIAAALDEHAWEAYVQLACEGKRPKKRPDEMDRDKTRIQAMKVIEPDLCPNYEILFTRFPLRLLSLSVRLAQFGFVRKDKVKRLLAVGLNRDILTLLESHRRIHEFFPDDPRTNRMDWLLTRFFSAFQPGFDQHPFLFMQVRAAIMDAGFTEGIQAIDEF